MTESNQQLKTRITSIDALRGFDMFWIIGGSWMFTELFKLLNAPFFDDLSRQLEHSEWHGFAFYDLIFPLFMFIMGVVMPLSFNKHLERGEPKRKIYAHVIKRSALLILLGLVHNGLLSFNYESFRFAGVLQRFGICYFFASLILLNSSKPRTQAMWAAGILIFYWLIMALVPVPGHGMGVFTPEGNLASFIDRLLLPGDFCCFEYGDNEGLLSTIPAISTVLLGVLAGHLLRSPLTKSKKALYLVVAGVGCLVVALLWSLVFPINKLLWSSSYVLFAGGWSFLLLALFYWIIDIRGYQKWAFPFIVIGMNPITIYVAQGLFNFGIIANIFVGGFIDYLGVFKPLFWALCVFAVKWLFLFFLYKKRIFLKV
jgi:predicted acyltransferase